MELALYKSTEFQAPNKALTWLESQWHRIGWRNHIPHDTQAKRAYFNDIYVHMTYKNQFHLREVPYNVSLPLFFTDLFLGKIEKVFPNLPSLSQVLNKWIESNRIRLRKEMIRRFGGEYDDINALFANYTPREDAPN